MRLILLPPVLLLAACAAAQTPPSCGAERYEGLAGTPLADLPPSAARVTRAVRPGDMVTMDFVPDRLTLRLDEEDRLIRAECG